MDMIFETAIYINDWVTENIIIVIPALTFLWTMYGYKKDNFDGGPHEANKFIDLLSIVKMILITKKSASNNKHYVMWQKLLIT